MRSKDSDPLIDPLIGPSKDSDPLIQPLYPRDAVPISSAVPPCIRGSV